MTQVYSVVGHRSGGFDEAGLIAWARDLRARLTGTVSLGLVFMTPQFFPHAKQVLEILRIHAQIPLLAGCSGTSLIAGDREVEENAGVVLGLFSLPEARLTGVHFSQRQVEEANGPGYWHLETAVGPETTHGWLVFVDPFHLHAENWLTQWNEAYGSTPIVGGLASGDFARQATQVYLNGEAYDEGGVAISVGGGVRLVPVISQGCTPIGETWTITRADRNLIVQIANQPAYQVLAQTFATLPVEEQKKARGNLMVGLVVNEYAEEFHRGDFLIRNLLGGDPNSGVLAVGGLPRAGQTVQFQRRDAAAANEDMETLLNRQAGLLKDAMVYGGCLCSCNGRGKNLFTVEDHDAKLVQTKLGPFGLAGFFCNGEIGPIGDRNFLHGYTASLGLFVKAV